MKKPDNNPIEFSQQVQTELQVIKNIEVFLKRLENLKGDEAFAYVEARNYLATRREMISVAEKARLNAKQTAMLERQSTEIRTGTNVPPMSAQDENQVS